MLLIGTLYLEQLVLLYVLKFYTILNYFTVCALYIIPTTTSYLHYVELQVPLWVYILYAQSSFIVYVKTALN